MLRTLLILLVAQSAFGQNVVPDEDFQANWPLFNTAVFKRDHDTVYLGYFCLKISAEAKSVGQCAQAQFGYSYSADSIQHDMLGNLVSSHSNWRSIGPRFNLNTANGLLEKIEKADLLEFWSRIKTSRFADREHLVKVPATDAEKFIQILKRLEPDTIKIRSSKSDFEPKFEYHVEGATYSSKVLIGGQQNVKSIVFSPKGRYLGLVTDSFYGNAKIFSLNTGEFVTTLSGQSLYFDDDDRGFVTYGREAYIYKRGESNTIRFCDYYDLSLRTYLPDFKMNKDVGCKLGSGMNLMDEITGLSYSTSTPGFSPHHQSNGVDITLDTGGESIRQGGVDASGNFIVGRLDSGIVIWDAHFGQKVRDLEAKKVSMMTFSPDRTQIVAGHPDGSITIWDIASGKRIALLAGHTRFITSLTFSPFTQELLSSSADGTVRVWSLQK